MSKSVHENLERHNKNRRLIREIAAEMAASTDTYYDAGPIALSEANDGSQVLISGLKDGRHVGVRQGTPAPTITGALRKLIVAALRETGREVADLTLGDPMPHELILAWLTWCEDALRDRGSTRYSRFRQEWARANLPYCYRRQRSKGNEPSLWLPLGRDYEPIGVPPRQFAVHPRAIEGVWANVTDDAAWLYDDRRDSRIGYAKRLIRLMEFDASICERWGVPARGGLRLIDGGRS